MIAIILTTFLRDELMYKVIQSVLDNWNEQYILFIGDQGHKTKMKDDYFKAFNKKKVRYYNLPFDCGLAYARNYLVKQANIKKMPHCLITADNIFFIAYYKFRSIIEFLDSDPCYGMVGFNIWYYWMFGLKIKNDRFRLIKMNDVVQYNDINYRKYDLIPNFFLAKTKTLIDNPWDNRLKMTEAIDFFWNIKVNSKYKVFYTNCISAKRVHIREGEYKKYRNRSTTNEFRKIVMKKWGLNNWIMVG